MIKTKNFESDFSFVCSDIKNLKIENNLSDYIGKDEFKRNFKIDCDVCKAKKTENALYGSVILYLDITADCDSDVIMRFSADIEGVFKTSPDTDVSTFESMLELNGVTALYGISRGIITSISSIAFPSEVIRLPMLNINRLIQEKHSNN